MFVVTILKSAIELGTKGEVTYTEEEQKDLAVGNLTGSIFEKIKTKTMIIRDFENSLHSVTIEVARNVSHLQANSIANNFTIKWNKQNSIRNASTVEEVKSIYQGG